MDDARARRRCLKRWWVRDARGRQGVTRDVAGGHPGDQGAHQPTFRGQLPPGTAGAGQPGRRDRPAFPRPLPGGTWPAASGRADLALPPSALPEQLEVVFEEGVSVLSTALGDPGDLIERAHARGMLVISMVTTVEEAVRVAERGADVVVAQGAAEIIAEIVGEAGDRLLELGGALAESR
jgi:hypothetical protein